MSERWVSARIAVRLVRALQTLGVDAAPLDEVLRVPRSLGADPDARVPLSTLYDLWELGARVLKEPALAMLVSRVPGGPPHPDVYAFLIQTSPTVGAAMRAGIVHLPLRTTSFRLEMVEAGDECALVQHRPPSSRLGRQLSVEATLAEFVLALRRFHPTLAPRRIELEHGAPARLDALPDVFRCPIHYAAGRNALVLDASVLGQPMPSGDATLAAYFEARCRDALASLAGRDASIVEGVRDHVLRTLPARPSLSSTARALALSERTLRRRIAAESSSFEAIVTGTRIALANQHLARTDLSLTEIAYLVGFSEVSAFHRFYKRETGAPPRSRDA